MVRLKSRTECPPGGFQVTIPQLKQTREFWSFGEAVTWFRDIAVANPSLKLSTDVTVIANYIDQQNALRCLGMNGALDYVIQKGGPAYPQDTKKASLLKPVVAVADKWRQLAAGKNTLMDWVLDGANPVPPEESSARAVICAACPRNGKGDLTRWFTLPTSEEIRRQIGTAKELALTTPSDDQLNVCEACLCPLKLKVHVPMDYIKKHLTPTAQAALDKSCWIK